MQGHSARPATSTAHQFVAQPRKVREGCVTTVFSHRMISRSWSTENGVSPPLLFYTDTKTTTQKIASRATSAFFITGACLGLRLLAALAPPGEIFGEIVGGGNKTSRKKPPPIHCAPLAVGGGHVAVFAAPPWRLRCSFADTAGGFSWRSFLVFNLAGKTPYLQFASVAGTMMATTGHHHHRQKNNYNN